MSRSPSRAQSLMTEASACPRCAWQGQAAAECPQCGIVFAKVRQTPHSRTPASTHPREPSAADPPPRRFTLLPWLLCLLAVVSWITVIDSSRHEDGAPPRPTSAPGPDAPQDARARPPVEPRSADHQPAPTAATELVSPIIEDPAIAAPDDPTISSAPLATPSFTWHEGANGFVQGVEEARREGKPMAVYFYTDWCPYCRELEAELLGRAKVEDFLKHLVKIRVNPEKGTYERALADRYGVQGYPSFFIQPTPQASPRKIRRTDRNGLLTPEAFVANLERAAR